MIRWRTSVVLAGLLLVACSSEGPPPEDDPEWELLTCEQPASGALCPEYEAVNACVADSSCPAASTVSMQLETVGHYFVSTVDQTRPYLTKNDVTEILPGGQRGVAVAGGQRTLLHFALGAGSVELLEEFEPTLNPGEILMALDVHPGGDYLAVVVGETTCANNQLLFLDMREATFGAELGRFDMSADSKLRHLEFSEDGNRLGAVGEGLDECLITTSEQAYVFDTSGAPASVSEVFQRGYESRHPRAIDFHEDEMMIAFHDETIDIIDLVTASERTLVLPSEIDGDDLSLGYASWSADGSRLLMTCAQYDRILVIDPADGTILSTRDMVADIVGKVPVEIRRSTKRVRARVFRRLAIDGEVFYVVALREAAGIASYRFADSSTLELVAVSDVLEPAAPLRAGLLVKPGPLLENLSVDPTSGRVLAWSRDESYFLVDTASPACLESAVAAAGELSTAACLHDGSPTMVVSGRFFDRDLSISAVCRVDLRQRAPVLMDDSWDFGSLRTDRIEAELGFQNGSVAGKAGVRLNMEVGDLITGPDTLTIVPEGTDAAEDTVEVRLDVTATDDYSEEAWAQTGTVRRIERRLYGDDNGLVVPYSSWVSFEVEAAFSETDSVVINFAGPVVVELAEQSE